MIKAISQLMLKSFAIGLICFACALVAIAAPFETVINNGSPQNRVDIAIVGDGYTAAQLAQYRIDVTTFLAGVFVQDPYKEYQRYYNVHRIDVASNQSGADHPERMPPVFVDTAFDATYNCGGIQRLICVDVNKVNTAVVGSVPAGYFDIILVIVNDAEYGGSGGAVAVASINAQAVELILHEVGHSFGLLTDEYTTGPPPPCVPNVEPPEANATMQTVRALIKWNAWIDAATPIPTITTTPGVPGLYEGSRYCVNGLYRPTNNSKMRSLGQPWEQINTEQHVKRVYNFVSPIDTSAPAGPTVTININQQQVFNVTTPLPFTHTLTINWRVDGLQSGTGTQFTLIGGTLTPGDHTLQAIITDVTPLVRVDPGQVLTATRNWTVTVQAGTNRKRFDFDGDGKADVSVFRPTNGVWYLLGSLNGFTATQFGAAGDKLAPADFDGDGKTDIAVFRNGFWYLLRSTAGFTAVQFGQAGDLPVPEDYDGDGKGDIAVFRQGNWYWLQSSNGQFFAVPFGIATDKPVPADYDGDGKADQAVFRDGTWYLLRSLQGFTSVQFGATGDRPTVGDYDGDGKADEAVYRNGAWYLLRSQTGFTGVQHGIATDIPVAADYDGDGKTDIAVYRDGTWYLLRSLTGFTAVGFGAVGDTPVPSAFVP